MEPNESISALNSMRVIALSLVFGLGTSFNSTHLPASLPLRCRVEVEAKQYLCRFAFDMPRPHFGY